MSLVSSSLTLIHLIGLALAVGSATTKLVLLLGSRSDQRLLSAYLTVARPITRLLITGMFLLALSGISWLLLGRPFTPRLILKVALVVVILVMGSIIDHVVEPRFAMRVPDVGSAASPAFRKARRTYVSLESIATLLFYVILGAWTLG